MDAVRQVDPYTSNTIAWEDAVANEGMSNSLLPVPTLPSSLPLPSPAPHTNTHVLTLPPDDQWYPYQSATGYDAEMAITWVGDSLEDGLIGSITVAVNTSYTSPELSTQYSSFNVSEYLEEGLLPFASTSALEGGETGASQSRSISGMQQANHL